MSTTETAVADIDIKEALDFWKMKNLSTCEFESEAGISAWSEWDKITDTSDDDD